MIDSFKSKSDLATLREAVHEFGAKNYPTRWRGANERAAAAIQKCGARPDDPVLRTVAPLIALKILQYVMPCERAPEEPRMEDIKKMIDLKLIKATKPSD